MNVVITGSTQGIGLGLAREFLRRGHNVVISSRRADAVAEVVEQARAVGAATFVDAVHFAPHRLMDVAAWRADFVC